jgi:hypothetical protein
MLINLSDATVVVVVVAGFISFLNNNIAYLNYIIFYSLFYCRQITTVAVADTKVKTRGA